PPLPLPFSPPSPLRPPPLDLPCSRGAPPRRLPPNSPVRVAPDTVAVASNSSSRVGRYVPSPHRPSGGALPVTGPAIVREEPLLVIAVDVLIAVVRRRALDLRAVEFHAHRAVGPGHVFDPVRRDEPMLAR